MSHDDEYYYRREIGALRNEIARLRKTLAGGAPSVAPGDWCVIVSRGGLMHETPAKLVRYAPEYPNGGPWCVIMYDDHLMDDECGPMQTLAQEIRAATPEEIGRFEETFA